MSKTAAVRGGRQHATRLWLLSFRRAIARWALSKGPLRRIAEALRRQALTAQEGTLRRRLLWPLYRVLRSEVTASDLLAVLDALASSGVSCWLAGGWGVDALVQRQTRRHRDLDIVLCDFSQHAEAALAALEAMGYRRLRLLRYEIWMPERWVLSDGSLRLVDLLGIDWRKLADALGAKGEVDVRRLVFAEGIVAGRPVPCLSARVQLLFHSGYKPRPVEEHDMRLLKGLGAG